MSDNVDPQAHVLRTLYPEINAGGFSRVDGTVQFYTRVNALLRPSMRIVDYGAGRGEWATDPVDFRRQLRTLRGKVKSVVGADIDEAIFANPTLDEYVICPDRRTIPLEDDSVDLILADNVFEHIDEPAEVAAEIDRILRPGGWVCARTPNKWGYVAMAASLVPNDRHVPLLRSLQPARQSIDIFPTRYRLNTMTDLERHFPAPAFINHSYFWAGDPGYFGRSIRTARFVRSISAWTPSRLKPKIFCFIYKRP